MQTVMIEINKALRAASVRITEQQDTGGNPLEWKPEIHQFYRAMKQQVCSKFAPWRDRNDPTYYHTVCDSGIKGKFRCEECVTCPWMHGEAHGVPAKATVISYEL